MSDSHWYLEPGKTLQRARLMVAHEAVLAVERVGEHAYMGTVAGSGSRPYNCHLEARVDPSSGNIVAAGEARCECPMRFKCKHAVAILLTLAGLGRALRRDEILEPGGDAQAARPPRRQAYSRWDAQADVDLSLDRPRSGGGGGGSSGSGSSGSGGSGSGGGAALVALDAPAVPAGRHEPGGDDQVPWLVCYVLRPAEGANGQSVGAADDLQIDVSVLGRQGGRFLAEARPLSARHQPLAAADEKALAALEQAGLHPHGRFSSAHTSLVEVLSAVAATGMLRWGRQDGPTLRWGSPRSTQLSWRWEDGQPRQRLMVSLQPAASFALYAPAQIFIDLTGQRVGAIVASVPAPFLPLVARAPALDPDEVTQFFAALPAPLDSLLPPPLQLPVVDRARALQPCLAVRLELGAAAGAPRYAMGQLSFAYGDLSVGSGSGPQAFWARREGGLYRTARQPEGEQAARDLLAKLGAQRVAAGSGGAGMAVDGDPAALSSSAQNPAWSFGLGPTATQQDLLDLHSRLFSPLRAAGWQLDGAPDLGVHVQEVGALPEATLDDPEATGWFSLAMGVEVEGRQVALAPILLAALRDPRWGVSSAELKASRRPMVYLPAPDGSVLAVPRQRLMAWIEIFEALGSAIKPDGRGNLRLPLSDAHLLLDLERRDQLKLSAPGGLRRLAKVLAGSPQRAVTVPTTLRATLRPYQREGLNWLQMLREHGLGGVLADDMGLGKTLQVLAHLMVERRAARLKRPALVVCPTSVLGNWQAEAQRFAPSLKTCIYYGLGRKLPRSRAETLILTSYRTLLGDQEIMSKVLWSTVALDEAQHVKNALGKTYIAVCRLRADCRLALTGTPVENSLKEIWAQVNFVMPGLLGSHISFNDEFAKPIENNHDVSRSQALVARLRPFLLRRTRGQVVQELPPKTEIEESCELIGAQRDLYEVVRLSVDQKVRDAVRSRGVPRAMLTVLDALLKLRQVCCDPRLLKGALASPHVPSAKFKRLFTLLPDFLAAGRRVLIFSQFTSMLELIQAELVRRNIACLKLTGKTARRSEVVEAFRRGTTPVFLISLRAGGTGLNLPEADTVVHYDPWWNPAVEAQATARAHRMGQIRPVFVHRLVAKDSVEARIFQLQQRKLALADAVLAGGRLQARLEVGDIEALIAPLPPLARQDDDGS